MKRIYEWITKANQVLLFFAIIGGSALVAFFVYQTTRRYDPPHVSIAQTSEEAKKAEIKDVGLISQWSGLYVLGVRKRMVTPREGPWSKRSAYLGKGDDDGGQLVNVIFSRGDQRVRTLLKNDGLVVHYRAYEELPDKFKAGLFLCVTEDTDGNHRLDQEDRNDLYIVSERLEKPDIVINGVVEYKVISPTHVVVQTGESSDPHLLDIDVETQAQKEIVWKGN